jgi:mono/diheme cytochrome c family protein
MRAIIAQIQKFRRKRFIDKPLAKGVKDVSMSRQVVTPIALQHRADRDYSRTGLWRKIVANRILQLFALGAVTLGVCAAAGYGQSQTPEVKKEPIGMTSPASGSEMFNSYCAPCHGKDAKGNGPAATALKNPPANLTQLAKKNGGKFPADHVATVLRSGVAGAHGSTDMPIWGPLFSTVSGKDSSIVQMRIANLIHYLETLQEK